uniref:Coatomer subunit zeta n=1 Tax=Compsopogon caeruleus TaxID=31354 RepID=A0A7S1XCA1_9RHOD
MEEGGQPVVKALLILNAEGKRICSRFCDKSLFPDLAAEKALEEAVVKKVSLSSDGFEAMEDVFDHEDFIVVFKQVDDILYFAVAMNDENEVILAEVLSTLDEAVALLLHHQVFEENLLLNLKKILLVVDELVDQEGVILECNAADLVSRVGLPSYFADGVPLGEQTLTQALQTARDQFTRSILS